MAQPNYFDRFDPPPAVNPDPYNIPPDPILARRAAEEEERRRRGDVRADVTQGKGFADENAARLARIADAYNSDQSVKAYRIAITQLGMALNTGEGPQADLALTYAFAKAMDPDSVVRESEQGMVTDSQPWFQSMVERTKKQFGADGAGNYTPEARQQLRIQISNAVAQRVKVYEARRGYFEKQARALGVDPSVVVGEHDAKPFVPLIQNWVKQSNDPQRQGASGGPDNPWPGVVGEDGKPLPPEGGYGKDPETGEWSLYGRVTDDSPRPMISGDPYSQSPVSQLMSGVNKGIAGTFGLVQDIPNAMQSGMVNAANTLFGTELQAPDHSLGNSDWWQDKFRDAGFIREEPQTNTGEFLNRMGQSVGSAVLPVGGAATSIGRMGAGLASSAIGGAGAATAQQAFPGNPVAEFVGELAGSGIGGAGIARMGQRQAQNAVEAAVPTVQQLKDQAGQLYRAAEARGVVIPPAQTRDLAKAMRSTLAREGRVSPTGRISEVYPKAKEAIQLVQDYSGKPMTPTQLQVVREVIADGLTSAEKSERRIAGTLLDTFDQWAEPFAPELPAARQIASRYLQTEQLEQARELAGVQAGQFTGSGYENALRTQYRTLDRNLVKGRGSFGTDVGQAIENVSRGTPASNAARAAGRFAPTGPVSAALGTGGPAAAGMMLGGPTGGLVAGTAAAAIGTAGRVAATRMGIKNAARAELIARNGGNLQKVPLFDPATERSMLLAASGQLGQYVDPSTGQYGESPYYPNPFATGEVRRRGLFGSLP